MIYLLLEKENKMETISYNKFKEKIGWNVSNVPLEEGSLKLEDGSSVASIGGAKIFGVHFRIYYKYDVMKNTIQFPIIFTKGGGKLVVHNETELDEWLGNHCILCYLCDNLEIKSENLRGMDYKEIRREEIKHPNRLPIDELYDFSKEEFFGYRYIEV